MTGASGFYPSTSDPAELRRAVTEQARAQERNVLTFQQHMTLIQKLESNVLALSTANARLTTKLVRIETRMAVYASLGAGAGAGLVGFLQRFL